MPVRRRRLTFSPRKRRRMVTPGSTPRRSRYARNKAATKIQSLVRGFLARRRSTTSGSRGRNTGPMTNAGRPGRVRTRLPEKPDSSGITIIEENNNFSFWSHATATQPTDLPVAQRTAHYQLLAPLVGSSNDRQVEGSHTKYLGANIHFLLTNYKPSCPWTVRITVVELSETDVVPAANANYFTLGAMGRYWKGVSSLDATDTVYPFLNISMLGRRWLPHNTNEYRILKQKYVHFPAKPYAGVKSESTATAVAPGTDITTITPKFNWSEKHVHMFVPCNRILDVDNKSLQTQSGATPGGTSSQTRYTYTKPIVIVWELLWPDINWTTLSDELISCNTYIRHSYKAV